MAVHVHAQRSEQTIAVARNLIYSELFLQKLLVKLLEVNEVLL